MSSFNFFFFFGFLKCGGQRSCHAATKKITPFLFLIHAKQQGRECFFVVLQVLRVRQGGSGVRFRRKNVFHGVVFVWSMCVYGKNTSFF